MQSGLKDDRDAFFPQFVRQFYSAGDDLKVLQQEVDAAFALCQQSDQEAAIGGMEAFATTDFRADVPNVTVPTLVIHGAEDGVLPFAGSGQRNATAIPGSELVVIDGAPHGANVSNADEWNRAVLAFFAK